MQLTQFTGGKSSYSGPEVYELEINLQDGIILARLMEVLAGLKIKGINKTPKIKAHKIDNLTQVLKVMETEKIRLVSISKHKSISTIAGVVTLHSTVFRANSCLSAYPLLQNHLSLAFQCKSPQLSICLFLKRPSKTDR